MMGRRLFLASGGMLCGCAGAVHQVPAVGGAQVALAQAEVAEAGDAPPRRPLSERDAQAMMRSALARIRPSATRLCQEMAVGVCRWEVRTSRDRTLNAGAGGDGRIVINQGIMEYAANEEEVALVIGHEIGHHAANHVANSGDARAIGSVIGAAVMAAATVAAAASGPVSARAAWRSVESGANLGGAVGRLAFSKEQEREADYLAAAILYRAGVDLGKARGFLVTMARLSGRMETGILDSHPAGPERVAGWDEAMRDLARSNGALPPRRGV
ncbi:M48 family metallopeptidase [Falsiroseomonas sp.]|uniref:M48 family metallopeptidase n=1 Tax=Falsiroseomonas sp. TaxID=2870721 RepID=UPI003F6F051D